MKRGGGRRYYRPDDVELLRGIRHLLYDEGYTIKGVQRILKEQGVRHVIESVEPGSDGTEQGHNAEHVALGPTMSEEPDYPAEPNRLEVQRPPLVNPHPPIQAAPPPTAPPSLSPPPQAPATAAHPAMTAPQAAHAPQVLAPSPSLAYGPSQPAQQAMPTQQLRPSQQPISGPYAANPVGAELAPPSSSQEAQVALHAAPVPSETAPYQAPLAFANSQGAQQGAAALQPAPQDYPHFGEQEHSAAPDHIRQDVSPDEMERADTLPKDLIAGEPKYLQGQSATVSVEDGRTQLREEEQKSGFFARLRGRQEVEPHDREPLPTSSERDGDLAPSMSRDEIRRLQSTLFELLECKRILDMARSD